LLRPAKTALRKNKFLDDPQGELKNIFGGPTHAIKTRTFEKGMWLPTIHVLFSTDPPKPFHLMLILDK
jgi:hypothetical protein